MWVCERGCVGMLVMQVQISTAGRSANYNLSPIILLHMSLHPVQWTSSCHKPFLTHLTENCMIEVYAQKWYSSVLDPLCWCLVSWLQIMCHHHLLPTIFLWISWFAYILLIISLPSIVLHCRWRNKSHMCLIDISYQTVHEVDNGILSNYNIPW